MKHIVNIHDVWYEEYGQRYIILNSLSTLVDFLWRLTLHTWFPRSPRSFSRPASRACPMFTRSKKPAHKSSDTLSEAKDGRRTEQIKSMQYNVVNNLYVETGRLTAKHTGQSKGLFAVRVSFPRLGSDARHPSQPFQSPPIDRRRVQASHPVRQASLLLRTWWM